MAKKLTQDEAATAFDRAARQKALATGYRE
jgi:hypothetical protein